MADNTCYYCTVKLKVVPRLYAVLGRKTRTVYLWSTIALRWSTFLITGMIKFQTLILLLYNT